MIIGKPLFLFRFYEAVQYTFGIIISKRVFTVISVIITVNYSIIIRNKFVKGSHIIGSHYRYNRLEISSDNTFSTL